VGGGCVVGEWTRALERKLHRLARTKDLGIEKGRLDRQVEEGEEGMIRGGR
jgi:hypothetical protein